LAGTVLHPGVEWEGVDAAVVEKYASDLGQEARPPLFDLKGDLQLFVFAVAGAAGGFLAGYCWKALFGAQTEKKPVDDA
jgi:cobalt/nickel transport protein